MRQIKTDYKYKNRLLELESYLRNLTESESQRSPELRCLDSRSIFFNLDLRTLRET